MRRAQTEDEQKFPKLTLVLAIHWSLRSFDKSQVRKSRRMKGTDPKKLQEGRTKCTVEDIVALQSKRIIVFSGSGISAASGMSTFSDPGIG